MFDVSLFAKAWHHEVMHQTAPALQENYMAKLSKLGVKAPLGTPPAVDQLAKAIAKAQVANGGSGNFMGHPLNEHGTNDQVKISQIMVKHNVPAVKAYHMVGAEPARIP